MQFLTFVPVASSFFIASSINNISTLHIMYAFIYKKTQQAKAFAHFCCRFPSRILFELSMYCWNFPREQILGEDQRPLVVRKGKKIKDDHQKREVPPDAPIIDVS